MRPLRSLSLVCCLLLCFGGWAARAQETGPEDARKVADAIIKEAGRHLGKPYLYGGNGPESFDCTGFTCYVFNKFGYKQMAGRTFGRCLRHSLYKPL